MNEWRQRLCGDRDSVTAEMLKLKYEVRRKGVKNDVGQHGDGDLQQKKAKWEKFEVVIMRN